MKFKNSQEDFKKNFTKIIFMQKKFFVLPHGRLISIELKLIFEFFLITIKFDIAKDSKKIFIIN